MIRNKQEETYIRTRLLFFYVHDGYLFQRTAKRRNSNLNVQLLLQVTGYTARCLGLGRALF